MSLTINAEHTGCDAIVSHSQEASIDAADLATRVSARSKRRFSVDSNDDLDFSYCSKKSRRALRRQISHENLVLIFERLYKINLGGICNGFAAAALQAFLGRSLPFLKARMEQISSLFYKHHSATPRDAVKATVKAIESHPNLLNFCDRIALCQNPLAYPLLFDTHTKPTYQLDVKSRERILSLIESNAVRHEGGVCSIAQFTGVYNKGELVLYLQQFKEMCEKYSPESPVGIHLINEYHSISIGYDNKQTSWVFSDIDNNGDPSDPQPFIVENIQDISKLAEYIYTALALSDHHRVIMGSLIFALNKNADSLKEGVAVWFGDEKFRTLHQIAPQRSDQPISQQEQQAWLFLTLYLDDKEALHSLVKAGSNIDDLDSLGNTPLYKSILLDKPDFIKILAEAGAQMDLLNTQGYAPLHAAAVKGNSTAIELLVQLGAKVDVPNRNSQTPLHCAALKGKSDCAATLIRLGAQIDSITSKGCTPLHCAAFKGQLAVARELLSAGAKKDLRDNAGLTALDYAHRHNYPEVVELLSTP